MGGKKKKVFIPIQKCYPDEYLEYELLNAYIDGNCIFPAQLFQIRFCKNVDMVLFPHACTLIYFEFSQNGEIKVKFVGRVTQTMTTYQEKDALYLLLRLPPPYIFQKFAGIVNSVIDLDLSPLQMKTLDDIREKKSMKEKFDALISLVQESNFGFQYNKLIDEFVTNGILNSENLSIENLMTDLSYSPRYIRSVVKKKMGISVKRLYDILRLQNIMDAQLNDHIDSLSCAFDNGFYDIAHLNKNIRKLTGFSYASFKAMLIEKNKG